MRGALRIIDSYRINKYVAEDTDLLYFYEIVEDSLFMKRVLLMGDDYCSCVDYFRLKKTGDRWLTCEHRLAVEMAVGLGVVTLVRETKAHFQRRVNAFYGNIAKLPSEAKTAIV